MPLPVIIVVEFKESSHPLPKVTHLLVMLHFAKSTIVDLTKCYSILNCNPSLLIVGLQIFTIIKHISRLG